MSSYGGDLNSASPAEPAPPSPPTPTPTPAPTLTPTPAVAPPRADSWLREWTGPLSTELRLEPGRFGLGKVPARLKPDAMARSVCGFCSTGCALDIHIRDGHAVNITPAVPYPVNVGMACPKGWEALTPLAAPDRATAPLVREGNGSYRETGWDEAMRLFTGKFKELMAQHGPESVAFLSTGQIPTEEMALLGSLFKFGMGGLHGDSNTRQCMATSHVAYKQSFGFDAPPYTYADFEESDVLVFVGSNLCIAHPILWQRVLQNRHKPEIIVLDPRVTETAMNATQHLALRPKSDLILLYGVANILVQNGWINQAFIDRSTTGFAAFAEFIREFSPDKVAAESGLTVGQIFRFAETIHRGRAVSFWWTMGVNQGHESTRTAQAIINLALMTGNIGRPGTGANSVTGQCNAMGSRLFANATSLLGGRDFLDDTHRAEVAHVLDVPLERIPTKNSLAYDQIIDGVAAGTIKGLWVIGTNPAHSWIGRGRNGESAGFENVLDRLEMLVVQDMYTTTETARRAHLVLPAAGWGEKEGTFINSERRFGHVKKVARAPGQALSDFNIFRLVAEYWGCADLFREWSSPQAAFGILRRLSEGRPCDVTGIKDYAHLEAAGGIQWPFPQSAINPPPTSIKAASAGPPPGNSTERRLFEDGAFFTADGRANFIFDSPRSAAELPDAHYPFVLLTGRGTSAQWHTNTRTGKSAVLRSLYPATAYVEIHPDDAGRLGIGANEKVTVRSRRGAVECMAFLTATVPPGQVFMPMHYDDTNRLTRAEFDPHSRQPSYKHCAVRIERRARRAARTPPAQTSAGHKRNAP
jgi:assimilatory nitrate reductase catalytic subunit